MNKEIKVTEKENKFLTNDVNFNEIFNGEMDGLTPTFDRIKIPSGGGVAFEVPGDDPDSPDTVKEFEAVILYHQPINVYYKEKYNGSNNPPDCGSMDGKTGINADGEITECSNCPFSKFGSAEDGKGKACKQKRRIFLLREGEILPIILTLPTGSLGEFSKYIMRIVGKGKKSNMVVTKFSLKKAQNSSGITYSQAVFGIARNLTKDEYECVNHLTMQIKSMAHNVEMYEEVD